MLIIKEYDGFLFDLSIFSLILARNHNYQSIALPANSGGVYRYPHAEAAEIAMVVYGEANWYEMDITINLFSAYMVEISKQAL